MMQNLDAHLHGLPAEELSKLRDKITVMLRLGPKAKVLGRGESRSNPEGDFARDLYDALGTAMQRRTRVRAAPYERFAATGQFESHFQPAAEAAYRANAEWFPRQTRAERLSMLALYADLALDYLAHQGRPAVWHNLAAALRALPAVVDQSFPGYAAAGLLGKVQGLRTRGRSTV